MDSRHLFPMYSITLHSIVLQFLVNCPIFKFVFTHCGKSKHNIYILLTKCEGRPDIAAFKEVINMKYKTEKYIAVKNNMQRKFQERWKLFIDS